MLAVGRPLGRHPRTGKGSDIDGAHADDAWNVAVRAWTRAAANETAGPDNGVSRLLWPQGPDSAVILAGLRRRAARIVPDDADDVASEALHLMSAALGRGRVDPTTAPAYLSVLVRNRANDWARAAGRARARAHRAAGAGDTGTHDAVADAVDALGSQQQVAAALRRSDATTRRVVTAFMDLADLRRERPAALEVAAAAGVSRKTVFSAMSRFRDLIENADPE